MWLKGAKKVFVSHPPKPFLRADHRVASCGFTRGAPFVRWRLEPLLSTCKKKAVRAGIAYTLSITLLAEKCNEFNLPLWIATLDFKKAFVSISHASIWESLAVHGVPLAYVTLLSKLYQGQRARISGKASSQEFYIKKGTKQGDPISPMIFNSVLAQVMRTVKNKWKERKYGVQLGEGMDTTMQILRFADDILLVGRTLPQIKQMVADVARECAHVGLELHPAKTKIQHNGIGYGSQVKSAQVGGMNIEVVGITGTIMYLGRELSLTSPHEVELKHRVRKAWAKFGAFRSELTNKTIPLHLRLKLFSAVITPTILYGSVAWVMTQSRNDILKSTQMKMVRAILGKGRTSDLETGELESWVDWIREVAPDARKTMAEHNIQDWVRERMSRTACWQDKLQKMDESRWAKIVSEWQANGRRSRGHPSARWLDQFNAEP